MATYNITKNSLLFFSAKDFLDSIETLFEFRFVETSFPKWVLEFRHFDEFIWQRKPISFCLTTNCVKTDSRRKCYKIGHTNNKKSDEDGHILKMYYTLHELLVKAMNKPNLILPEEHVCTVADLKIGSPFEFLHAEFPDWQKLPGQTTIRIGNCQSQSSSFICIVNGTYEQISSFKLFWSFNTWKYREIVKSETPTNKRKLEPENTPEPVPELAKRVCQENDEP